jgi:hypothetical protein
MPQGSAYNTLSYDNSGTPTITPNSNFLNNGTDLAQKGGRFIKRSSLIYSWQTNPTASPFSDNIDVNIIGQSNYENAEDAVAKTGYTNTYLAMSSTAANPIMNNLNWIYENVSVTENRLGTLGNWKGRRAFYWLMPDTSGSGDFTKTLQITNAIGEEIVLSVKNWYGSGASSDITNMIGLNLLMGNNIQKGTNLHANVTNAYFIKTGLDGNFYVGGTGNTNNINTLYNFYAGTGLNATTAYGFYSIDGLQNSFQKMELRGGSIGSVKLNNMAIYGNPAHLDAPNKWISVNVDGVNMWIPAYL